MGGGCSSCRGDDSFSSLSTPTDNPLLKSVFAFFLTNSALSDLQSHLESIPSLSFGNIVYYDGTVLSSSEGFFIVKDGCVDLVNDISESTPLSFASGDFFGCDDIESWSSMDNESQISPFQIRRSGTARVAHPSTVLLHCSRTQFGALKAETRQQLVPLLRRDLHPYLQPLSAFADLEAPLLQRLASRARWRVLQADQIISNLGTTYRTRRI